MRLIDRYVAWNFFKNYVISFLVLVGMYIVLDMIFNFDELVEINKPGLSALEAVTTFIHYTADFYFYQMFLYFAHLSGIIPVVAAAFTIMRMVRFNELSALLSAGVPLLRVAMPVLMVGLGLNALVWVDQELVLPNMIDKLVRKHDYGTEAETGSFPVSAMQDDQNSKLFASRYLPLSHPPRMNQVSIIKVDENNRPVSHIKAAAAIWDAGHRRWRLEDGEIDLNLSPDQPDAVRTEKIDYYQGSITPEELQLYRSGDFVEFLSTERINQLLNRPRSYGQAALLRVKHTRGPVQIILNMIMLMLAISAVLTRDPQSLKLAATRCVMLCGSCMTAVFMSHEMAGQTPMAPQLAAIWPALMAWMPIFTFGPMAIYLLDRVKT